MGRIIPYIMENTKCLKPPTSYQTPTNKITKVYHPSRWCQASSSQTPWPSLARSGGESPQWHQGAPRFRRGSCGIGWRSWSFLICGKSLVKSLILDVLIWGQRDQTNKQLMLHALVGKVSPEWGESWSVSPWWTYSWEATIFQLKRGTLVILGWATPKCRSAFTRRYLNWAASTETWCYLLIRPLFSRNTKLVPSKRWWFSS